MSNPQAGSAQTEAIAAKHRSGLRHGCVRLDNAVLNTLQAIALDATRRLHPLALSSIVSTLALLGVSTLRATPAQALTITRVCGALCAGDSRVFHGVF